jgi:hypothetical protein
MVTHEPDIAAHARRVVVLRDGQHRERSTPGALLGNALSCKVRGARRATRGNAVAGMPAHCATVSGHRNDDGNPEHITRVARRASRTQRLTCSSKPFVWPSSRSERRS